MPMARFAEAPGREAPPISAPSAPVHAPPRGSCAALVVRFGPDHSMAAPQTDLTALGREETSERASIRAVVTHRIVPTCP